MKTFTTNQKRDNQVMIAKPYLSLEEACEYLSLSKATLYAYTSRKKISHYKISRKILFKVTELNEFIEIHRIASISEIEQQAADYLVTGKV